MSEKRHIVVIGGTACGPKAAARARRCDPKARITIIEQGENISSATCGLPYYISGAIRGEEQLVARKPDFFTKVMDIEVLIQTKAISIDRKAHRVSLLDLKTNKVTTIPYDKLVLATGSTPVIPEIEGINLKGIFTLSKVEDAIAIRRLITEGRVKRVVIVGAGLIGLEGAEAFSSAGCEVTLVEALDWILPELLDFEVARHVEKHLKAKGVELLLGQRVTGFEGDKDGWVHRVKTSGKEIETDLVLIAIGIRPNIELAKEAGLTIGSTGGVAVNEYLQTSDPDIYAGGDCVENKSLITGKEILAPLGSTANKHGRVIGTNVTSGCETFPGVTHTAICKVFDYNVARVGLSETQAEKAGFEVFTGLVPGWEYATYYPGGKDILVKLIAEQKSGRILGGQVAGPGEAAKRVDVLATAITFGATVDDLANLDLAYAPPYNSALDPLHHAANLIRNKRDGLARTLSPMEVKARLDGDDSFILLDVRSKKEWERVRLQVPQAKLLPLDELRERTSELPKDKEIVIFCRTSVRAYQAQRILDGDALKEIKFMEGSLASWPYDELSTS